MTIPSQSPSPSHLRVAMDAGFHAIKTAIILNQTLFSATLPAVVGMGETDLGLLASGINRSRRQQPYRVTLDGQHLLVGPYVNQYARPIERLDFERFSTSIEMRALVYAGLAQLLRQLPGVEVNTPIDLSLIVALPVQVLQSTEARRVVSSLEDWLIGQHPFDVDRRPYHLRIHAIKAMAQPLGSFFEWGLGLDGQWSRSQADLKASVGVLDQGFNTLDLFTLAGGQIIRRYTGGETLGMRRAARLMQDLFQQQTGRKLSLHEADDFLQQASNGHPANVLVHGESVNLKPLAHQALDVSFSELRAYLSQVWEDGRQFDAILLTGGGVLALGERLRTVYPQAIDLPDPISANVRGLARFAQRKGVLETANQVA